MPPEPRLSVMTKHTNIFIAQTLPKLNILGSIVVQSLDTTSLKKTMMQTNLDLKIMKSKLELLFVPHKERYINLSLDSTPIKIEVITEMQRYC
jgi:hypothetical protein